MLTDYHTHLRPDDPEASPDRYFTVQNAERYLEAAAEHGVEELGFSEHVYRFREALQIWRHPFWEQYAVDDLDRYCEFVEALKAAGHGVKLGLEVDYIPGREDRIADLLDGWPFDYVIGSVHFIADRAVDHEGYDAWRESDPDGVWSEYFRCFGDAAASGLFDVLAHPDLVKVWGAERPAPPRDPRHYYELAMDGIRACDAAIEVSTAGLRKPVREIYPSRDLLAMCLEAGRPVALSSDAHVPEHIGFEFETAVVLLRAAGVERIAVFSERVRTEEPVG